MSYGSAASVLAAVEKGESATPVSRMTESLVNRKDSAWLQSKLTPTQLAQRFNQASSLARARKLRKRLTSALQGIRARFSTKRSLGARPIRLGVPSRQIPVTQLCSISLNG